MKNILIITPYYPYPDNKKLLQDTKAVYYLCKESRANERIIIAYYYRHSRTNAYKALPRLLKKITWKDCYFLDDKGHEILLLEHPCIIPHNSQTLRFFDEKYSEIINAFLKENNITLDTIVVHFPLQNTELCKKINAMSRVAIVHSYDVKNDDLLNITIKNLPMYNKIGFRSRQIESRCKPYINNQETFMCLSGIPDYMVPKELPMKPWKQNGILKLVYAGKLNKNKNVCSVISALGVISKEINFEFSVVGDGIEKKKLITLSEKLGIGDSVRFLGRLSREEVFDIMKMSDVFIMASYKETLGLVYFEAMAAGNIVVASQKTGIDGIVSDHSEVLFVDPKSIANIALHLKELYFMDEKQVINMRRNSYEFVINFTESKMSREYLDRM